MANGTSDCWRVRLLQTLRSLALVCALPVFLSAQFKPANPPESASEAPPTTFSVKVNLVRLLVSARDAVTGAPLTNLNRGDFEVTDSGVPQTITVFERNTSLPLSVAVLIDCSGSTQIDLHYEEDSVLRFIPLLLHAGNPDDAYALFSFNWRTSMDLDFTRSQKRAEKVLRSLHGEGGTSLYDAIYLASGALNGREGRHVMVVVTDGGDTTSYKKFDDALEAAQESDVVLYPVVVVPIENDAGRNIGGEHALATLASSTGGQIFYPAGFEHVDEALTAILQQLRTQYLIGFYPQGTPEKHRSYHPVTVKTRTGDVKVSARSGYYEP